MLPVVHGSDIDNPHTLPVMTAVLSQVEDEIVRTIAFRREILTIGASAMSAGIHTTAPCE